MTSHPGDAPRPAPRYGAVLAAWTAVAVGVPAVVLVVIYLSISARCSPEATDCSWGFEYLLAVPFALGTWLIGAPLAVRAVLRSDRTARRTGALVAVTAWPSLVLATGALLARAVPVAIAVGAGTALAARWAVLRRETSEATSEPEP